MDRLSSPLEEPIQRIIQTIRKYRTTGRPDPSADYILAESYEMIKRALNQDSSFSEDFLNELLSKRLDLNREYVEFFYVSSFSGDIKMIITYFEAIETQFSNYLERKLRNCKSKIGEMSASLQELSKSLEVKDSEIKSLRDLMGNQLIDEEMKSNPKMAAKVNKMTSESKQGKRRKGNQTQIPHQPDTDLYDMIKKLKQTVDQTNANYEESKKEIKELSAKYEEVNSKYEEVNSKYEEVNSKYEESKQELNRLKAGFAANMDEIRSDLANLKQFNATVIFRELIFNLRLKAVNHCFRKDLNQTEFGSWDEFTQFARAQNIQDMINQVDSFIINQGIDWRKCLRRLKKFNTAVHQHSLNQISKALDSGYMKPKLITLMQQVHDLLNNFPPRSPALEENKE